MKTLKIIRMIEVVTALAIFCILVQHEERIHKQEDLNDIFIEQQDSLAAFGRPTEVATEVAPDSLFLDTIHIRNGLGIY